MLNEAEIVTTAYRDFIDAGARVITAKTYSAMPSGGSSKAPASSGIAASFGRPIRTP